uniref:Cytochrome P450 n=1 Tax=Oryza meridionalis TaxID=40149 RepID=A0A0E0EC42_9ORYZ
MQPTCKPPHHQQQQSGSTWPSIPPLSLARAGELPQSAASAQPCAGLPAAALTAGVPADSPTSCIPACSLLASRPTTSNSSQDQRGPQVHYRSLDFPWIGQSISLLRALRSNTDYQWYQDRIKKYGPVSKMSVFGSPTVLMAGPASNHFVFSNQDLIFTQTKAINVLIGRSIMTLSGDELKQVRSALQGYLSPEMVTKYIWKMDEEVRKHIYLNWVGHKTIKVAPLAKRLTFNIISSVMFGQGAAPFREALATDFEKVVRAALLIPVNIPFTKFNEGLRASRRIRKLLGQIAQEREAAFQQGHCSSADDFFTYMLALRSEGRHSLTVEDIVDNAILLLIAGYETSSVLITFLIRQLANEPDILGKITDGEQLVLCICIWYSNLPSSIAIVSTYAEPQNKRRSLGTKDLTSL